jgi:hypothetical protein
MKFVPRIAAILAIIFLMGCKSEKPAASSAGSRPGLVATHTAISLDQVPKDLLKTLDFPYIRFYRTDITNKTDRPIRIVWFDGYFEYEGSWRASNVRNKVLRTTDFLDWYSNEDIDKPGGVASCLVNWHWTDTPEKLGTKWAYVGVDSSGHDYFAEAVVPDIAPIKLK